MDDIYTFSTADLKEQAAITARYKAEAAYPFDDAPRRLITNQPFSLYYKIAGGDQLTHIIAYPGGIKSFTGPNDNCMHQHNHFELFYVLRGELQNRIDNVTYRYKKGDACLLNRNIFHSDTPGPDCAVVFVDFLGDYIEQVLSLEKSFDIFSRSRAADILPPSANMTAGRNTANRNTISHTISRNADTRNTTADRNTPSGNAASRELPAVDEVNISPDTDDGSILPGQLQVTTNKTDKALASDYGKIHDFLLSNIRGEQRYYRSYMEFTSTLQALASPKAPTAEEIIDGLQLELLNGQPGSGYTISGLLCRLIHSLEDTQAYHANVMQLDLSNEDFLFARIDNYLKESHGRISRTELSRALNYNAEYLNQIARRRSGKSLKQLGKIYSLEYAKELLGESSMSIAQIINTMGFTSSSHFYTFFRDQTGISPAQYRKLYRSRT